LKLLHVVPTYLPAHRYGGPIVAVHGLCKALAERGHEVTVFTTNVDGDGELDVPEGISVPLDGVHVYYFPSTFRRLYRSPAMRRALGAHVPKVDLVHSHAVFLWPGVAAAGAARKHGKPYVISPRGMLVPELIRARSRMAKTLWLKLVERRALARASAIHYTSQLEADDARRTGLPLAAPFVVPNGIDLPAKRQERRDENTLLFLGRINWKKGLDRAIQALPQGARLIVAGNDEENLTPRLRELAEKLGVGERVEFPGPVYGDAKWELLGRATLFVLLSQSENFGNAVLEALAMETPAVLSKGVGLADEVVRAGAGIIGVDGISALLRDPARRAEMGRSGRALVESRFTWPRVAAEMEKEYERCCSTTSRR
jgi:glycosyltransferase involved in cell wall biosynthesis